MGLNFKNICCHCLYFSLGNFNGLHRGFKTALLAASAAASNTGSLLNRSVFTIRALLTVPSEFILIDNSIKYAKKINIDLEKVNSNIILIINDDGIGIPENEYDNVFKPFYKIDKSRGETKSSVGLGLSITSDIVKSHGGNISLSQSKQKGLRVKSTLPI